MPGLRRMDSEKWHVSVDAPSRVDWISGSMWTFDGMKMKYWPIREITQHIRAGADNARRFVCRFSISRYYFSVFHFRIVSIIVEVTSAWTYSGNKIHYEVQMDVSIPGFVSVFCVCSVERGNALKRANCSLLKSITTAWTWGIEW